MPQYFIIGTDTNIGKTHSTCQLAKTWINQGKRVKILKPVATGCELIADQLISEDKQAYEACLNSTASIQEGWTFQPPVSPHLAAQLEERTLTAQEIATWCQLQCEDDTDVVLIEGAGGLMVPLNDQETWLDVLRLLNIPVILVVGIKLGCLNHALLTAAVLEKNDIKVCGWIANHVDPLCLYPEELIQTLKNKFTFSCIMELPFEPDLKE